MGLLQKTTIKRFIFTLLSVITIFSLLSSSVVEATHALYENGKLVGHGYDALSTQGGLNPPTQPGISRDIRPSDPTYTSDWEGKMTFTDQNGDVPNPLQMLLYPGETMHVKYVIKYTGAASKMNIVEVAGDKFLTFRKDLFGYVGDVNVTASNPATNPVLTFSTVTAAGKPQWLGKLHADELKPGDSFAIEFDVQTSANLKEVVIADRGSFPYSYNINSTVDAIYEDTNTVSLSAGIQWTQNASTFVPSKQVTATTTQNPDEATQGAIVDVVGDGDVVKYRLELDNTTKGSLQAQVIRDSLFEKLPLTANDVKITSLQQVHTVKNPLVSYVELSTNKGTPITTGGVATQAQIDLVTEAMKAGTFVVDEIQEGDKIVIEYEVTIPKAQDTDADGITDQFELKYAAQGMDFQNPCSLSGGKEVPNPNEDPSDPADDTAFVCDMLDGAVDSDGDGRVNSAEIIGEYDPFNPDQNNNTVLDGKEEFQIGLNNDFIYDRAGNKKSTTTPYAGYPSVRKTSLTGSGDKLITPGELVNYTVEIANFTAGKAYNIQVRDNLYETLSKGSNYGFTLVPGYTIVDATGAPVATTGDLAAGTLQIPALLSGQKAFIKYSSKASSDIKELVGTSPNRLTNVVTIDGTTPTDSDKINGEYGTTSAKASDMIPERTGTLKIVKKDALSGRLLAGVQFVAHSKTKDKQYFMQTDENGVASFVLPIDEYVITEDVPVGYKQVPAFEVKIEGETEIQKEVLNSQVQREVHIKKVNPDGQALSGAKFKIEGTTNIGDSISLTDLVTNSEGLVLQTLPQGKYTITETEAPKGYAIDATPQEINLQCAVYPPNEKLVNPPLVGNAGDCAIAELSFTNTIAKGNFKIIKVDSETGEVLKGAKFTLTGKSDLGEDVNYSVETDENGVATIPNVLVGTYKLKEVSAPAKYNIDVAEQDVTIKSNTEEVVKVADTKQKGQITLIKKDATSKKVLEHAIFEVFNDKNELVDTIETNAEGVATSKSLPLGTYKVVEKTAPLGYEKNTTTFTAVLEQNEELLSIGDVLNERETGLLQILKLDVETKQPLANAEFSIEGKTVIGETIELKNVKTNAEGIFLTPTGLPIGEYTIKETSAPEGYKLDAPEQKITIKKGETAVVTFNDTKKLGGLSGIVWEDGYETKNDGLFNNEEKVTGVKVYLLDANGNRVLDANGNPVTQVTDANGYYEFTKLVPGNYGVEFETPRKATTQDAGNNANPTVDSDANADKKITVITVVEDNITPNNDLGLVKPVGSLSGIIWHDGYETKNDGLYNNETKISGVTVYLLDANGQRVLDANGNPITQVTDANGFYQFKDLVPGNYGVEFATTDKATTQDAGNNANPTKDSDANADRKIVLIKVVANQDTPNNDLGIIKPVTPKTFGKIEVTKTNEDGTLKLSDAVFEIKDGDTVVDTIKTNESGVAVSKELPLKTYSVVEKTPPTGYELDQTAMSVELKTSGETVKVSKINKRIKTQYGKITVSKFDKETKNRLSGMIFKIKSLETGKETIIEMNDNNVMEIINLPLGKYEITEIKAPNGYDVDPTVYSVSLEKDQDVKFVDVYDVRHQDTPQPPAQEEVKSQVVLPNTGDTTQGPNSALIIAVLTAVVMLIVGFVFITKRKDKNTI